MQQPTPRDNYQDDEPAMTTYVARRGKSVANEKRPISGGYEWAMYRRDQTRGDCFIAVQFTQADLSDVPRPVLAARIRDARTQIRAWRNASN